MISTAYLRVYVDADGAEEMVVADQIGNALLAQAVHGSGLGRAQVPHHGQGIAVAADRLFDAGAQLIGVLRGDLHRVKHPTAPTVQAEKQSPLAVLTGGIDVQGIPSIHGGT